MCCSKMWSSRLICLSTVAAIAPKEGGCQGRVGPVGSSIACTEYWLDRVLMLLAPRQHRGAAAVCLWHWTRARGYAWHWLWCALGRRERLVMLWQRIVGRCLADWCVCRAPDAFALPHGALSCTAHNCKQCRHSSQTECIVESHVHHDSVMCRVALWQDCRVQAAVLVAGSGSRSA